MTRCCATRRTSRTTTPRRSSKKARSSPAVPSALATLGPLFRRLYVSRRPLLVLSLSAVALTILCSAQTQPQPQSQPGRTLLRAGHLADVCAGPLLDAQTLV